MDYNTAIVKGIISKTFVGIFLLLVTISGNYLGDLLPCSLQLVLTKMPIVKHIFAIFSLYFFINLSTPTIQNPLTTLFKTILMYSIFIVTSKLLFGYIIIIIISMFLITYIHDYKMYHHYENNKQIDNSTENIKKINLTLNILLTIIVVTLIIGVIRSSNNSKLENVDSKWSWYKYLIEPHTKCLNIPKKDIFKKTVYF